jgi:hypothetical protein
MPKNTCEIQVGRLLEIRASKGYETPQDVEDMIGMIKQAVQKLPADVKHVTVADWRACKVLSEAACEEATRMFNATNPRTERSALLCTDASPTAVWQFVRLITSASNAQRRLFTREDELIEWLGEVLDPAERRRLQQFLSSTNKIGAH